MITAEDIINEKNKLIISVSPEATIIEALKVMVNNNIGSILVKESNQYIGIYTEREFVHDSIIEGFNPHSEIIRDHMVTRLVTAKADETIHELQDKFLGACLRHLLVKKGKKVIGLISAGDVTRADLVEHEKQLHSITWDYYENWKWGKKK